MKVNVNEETVTVVMSKQEAVKLEEGLYRVLGWIYDEFEGLDEIDDLHWELYKLFKGI